MDLLNKKYRHISDFKAEIERLNNCLMESLTHEKNALDVSIKYKDENERLKQELATYGATGIYETCTDKANKQADKYYKTLQEIKAIAEQLLEKGLEPQSVEHQLRLKGKKELASIILDLITKAESEEE